MIMDKDKDKDKDITNYFTTNLSAGERCGAFMPQTAHQAKSFKGIYK